MIPLPTFTFLTGNPASGKTTLAMLLAQNDPSVAMASFDEPLREATLSLFFPHAVYDNNLDLRNSDTLRQCLPLSPLSIQTWLTEMRFFLMSKISMNVLGDLAKRRSNFILGREFRAVVYDDTRSFGDVSPFLNAFGREYCRLIILQRGPEPITKILKLWEPSTIPKSIIRNPEGSPEEMLSQLRSDESLSFMRRNRILSPPEPRDSSSAPDIKDL